MSNLIQKLKKNAPQLSVGTLTGDMMNQASDLALLKKAGVEVLHLDVMDGRTWPKITVGSGFLAGLKTSLIKDVHLLIEEPEKHVADFAKAGADIITFQIEHTEKPAETLAAIAEAGALRSVGIYPTTPLEKLTEHLDAIDVVFVLSIGVETGKETYFETVAERVQTLRQLKPELVIAIDGAVKVNNVGEIASMKPDLIVTGSAIFDGKDPAGNIAAMHSAIATA